MSNPLLPTDNTAAMIVSFHGPDVRKAIRDNRDIVDAVWNTCGVVDGTIKVFVTPRNPEGFMEWTLVVSSPKGRSTHNMTQRMPGGVVQIS
jgi:hypothetical protein